VFERTGGGKNTLKNVDVEVPAVQKIRIYTTMKITEDKIPNPRESWTFPFILGKVEEGGVIETPNGKYQKEGTEDEKGNFAHASIQSKRTGEQRAREGDPE